MTALVLAAAVALTIVVACGVLVTVYEISHRDPAVLREDERHD